MQGEIRATGFNEQADAFYEILQEGKVSHSGLLQWALLCTGDHADPA